MKNVIYLLFNNILVNMFILLGERWMDKDKSENTKCNEFTEDEYKGAEFMEATIDRSKYKRLDFSKLKFNEQTISSTETLADVSPIMWADEVVQGKKKVIIKDKR
jgi:hypothetical protein